MIYLQMFASADIKSRDMNINTTRAQVIIMFILIHFIAEKDGEENEMDIKNITKNIEIKIYYEAVREHMLRPVEVYMQKAKEKDYLALPNDDNRKDSEDVLIPTPKETIGIVYIAYLGFWIAVRLKVCNMAYKMTGAEEKASQCEQYFENMKILVEKVFQDHLSRVTADDIAKELSCLDLRFLVKIKSQNMIIPNRKCPLNIIQWQNMQNYIWHLSFSDIAENIKQNYFTSATVSFSDINRSLYSVINFIELRTVQTFFSKSLNGNIDKSIIDAIVYRYYPGDDYMLNDFIHAITEESIKETINPVESLLEIVKKWIDIDMEWIMKD